MPGLPGSIQVGIVTPFVDYSPSMPSGLLPPLKVALAVLSTALPGYAFASVVAAGREFSVSRSRDRAPMSQGALRGGIVD